MLKDFNLFSIRGSAFLRILSSSAATALEISASRLFVLNLMAGIVIAGLKSYYDGVESVRLVSSVRLILLWLDLLSFATPRRTSACDTAAIATKINILINTFFIFDSSLSRLVFQEITNFKFISYILIIFVLLSHQNLIIFTIAVFLPMRKPRVYPVFLPLTL